MSELSHLRAMRTRALNEAAFHFAGGEFEAGVGRLRVAFEFSDAVASMLVPSPVEPAERSEAAQAYPIPGQVIEHDGYRMRVLSVNSDGDIEARLLMHEEISYDDAPPSPTTSTIWSACG